MGCLFWMIGCRGFTASLQVDYRRPLPVDSEAFVVAEVATVEGRKVNLKAKLVDPNWTVFAESKGLFVVKDPSKALAVPNTPSQPQSE